MMTPCARCVYWVVIPIDDTRGECHRHAPRPVTGDGYVYASWPQTSRSDSGCGEGKPDAWREA